jgi:hypothetical protein
MTKPIYRRHPRNPAAQPFNVAPKHGKKKNSWWNPQRKVYKHEVNEGERS